MLGKQQELVGSGWCWWWWLVVVVRGGGGGGGALTHTVPLGSGGGSLLLVVPSQRNPLGPSRVVGVVGALTEGGAKDSYAKWAHEGRHTEVG